MRAPAIPADPGTRGPWAVLKVRDTGGLSCKARLAGLVLATYVNGASGQAWPHLSTLMAGTGLSRRGVQTALRELEQCGLISLARRGRYGRVYQFEGRSTCTPEERTTRASQAAEERTTRASEERSTCAPEKPEGRTPRASGAHLLRLRGAPPAPPIGTMNEAMKEGSLAAPAKSKRRKARVDPYPRPEGVEPQPWADFLANRARKKMANTATAHKRLLTDLARLADDEWPPGRLLEFAAARGWCGIYDPRELVVSNGRLSGSRSERGGGSLVDLWRAARDEADAEEAEAEREGAATHPRIGLAL